MTPSGPTNEEVDITTLRLWKRNPRRNTPAQVKRVADSISRFGFAAPIVARKADRTVIAGHTRLAAAKKLGLTTVPVRWVDLSEGDARLLALADNRLTELGEWDDATLTAMLGELRLENVDVPGWDGAERRLWLDVTFMPA